MKNKNEKKVTDQDYFEEAQSWDANSVLSSRKSEKRAWVVAGFAGLIAILEAVAITSMMPLKSVEPFVIRTDPNTGYTDVVSTLAGTAGEIKEKNAQEVLDKFWLGKYIKHREAYEWATRDNDRQVVGLMSDPSVQQQYAEYTDPQKNPQAPITVYSDTATVEVKVTAISFLNEEKNNEKENVITALVRYTKQVKRKGELTPITHWASTISFVYRNGEMTVEDRLINPLGFQVISYRNDQESVGAQ